MSDLYQEIKEFTGGVQSAAAADRIPLNATPFAVNSAFRNIGSGQANIGTRPGLVTVNTTAMSGEPGVMFQRLYSYDTGLGFTNYLVVVADDGTLRFKDDTDTLTAALAPPANFPSPSGLCFTAGDVLVDGTVMNNRLFLMNAALERRSLLGEDYHSWGLSPIATVAVSAAAAGANAMPDETYDVSTSTYDDDTGAESAISTYVSQAMGGANRRIKIDITPTAAEIAQYPYWRVYLRRQTTQADQYQVQTFYNLAGAAIVTDGNIPIGTTTVYVDMAAATIANLTTIGPSQAANGLPPASAKYITTYGRRLIMCDDRNVYWSQLDKPDAFSITAYEPIDTGDGDKITGVYPFSAELCVIFTQTATWGIFGNDPESWVIRPIDHTIGSCSHLSVVEFDGELAWWSENDGPVIFNGEIIKHQGLDDLGWEQVVQALEPTRLDHIYGGYDPQGQRAVWSVALSGSSTRNNRLIPYNTRIRRFEASYWNPMDLTALSMGYIEDGTQRLFAGGYGGQVFYFDADTLNDGVPSGTMNTTFTAAGSTITTITSSGFYTTGAGLAERSVVVTDSSNRPVGKGRILSNTATELTLAVSMSGLSTGATYNAYVGSPDFRFFTKWIDMDQTFIRKRFDRLYLQAQSGGDAANIYATTQINFVEESNAPQNPFSVEAAQYDSAIFDSSMWAGVGQLKKRLFIGRTGQTIRVGIYHFHAGQDLTLHTVALLARALSDRYYEI